MKLFQTKPIDIVRPEDVPMKPMTHVARCLVAGCYLADEPKERDSESAARFWAECHIVNNRDHSVSIEEIVA